jgi:hypothetical protein
MSFVLRRVLQKLRLADLLLSCPNQPSIGSDCGDNNPKYFVLSMVEPNDFSVG